MKNAHQVAALPWRQGKQGVEILLVTTRTTKRWVIPKGWPMVGMPDHDAAAQEAFEEAGVRGGISSAACGRYGYLKISEKGKARPVTVTVYPLFVDKELADWPERLERERRWISGSAACELAGEPELVSVLKNFVDHPPEVTTQPKVAKKSFWQKLLAMFR